MDATPGTPHLLTDVRFSVSRKGYDPDEVDNFLERVSAAVAQLQDKLRQATANAEAADGRASDATRSQTALQAKVDSLQAQVAAPAPAGPTRTPEDDAAEVSKVLVLAQRTADAAVAEARASSSQMVNDAEQEAARILVAARTEADHETTRQRTELIAEVQGLETTRGQLSSDIASLDRYLDDQRSALRGALARMGAVLDDPSSLRMAAPPTTTPTDAHPTASPAGSDPGTAGPAVPGDTTLVVVDGEPAPVLCSPARPRVRSRG